MNANLYALLRSHFEGHLDQPCVLIPGGPVIHYDELDAASSRIAHALTAAGCVAGDRVAVQTGKCWQALALYLACLRAGLVYLPLNTAYCKAELAYFFGDAEPRVIVCAPDDATNIAALRPEAKVLTLAGDEGSLLEAARDHAAQFDTVVSAPGDLAALLYTSGTTGRSKGAMITHRTWLPMRWLWSTSGGSRAATCSCTRCRCFTCMACSSRCHCALLSASRILWLPRFDAAEVVRLLPHATVMMGVPTYLLALACRSPRSAPTPAARYAC